MENKYFKTTIEFETEEEREIFEKYLTSEEFLNVLKKFLKKENGCKNIIKLERIQ